jgi:hypothetical protein
MSSFTYLVEVETNRDSGLIVSRDDQSEKIIEALEQADTADLSGLGARSDSEYSVTLVGVTELEKRDLKQINSEYEESVRAAEPTDKELRLELKSAKLQIESLQSQVKGLQAIQDALMSDVAHKPSRIYQEDSTAPRRSAGRPEAALRTYLDDGEHDRVLFAYGDAWEERFEVALKPDNSIELRSTGGSMLIQPIGGNSVRILPTDHFGRLKTTGDKS